MNTMAITSASAEHYTWGAGCDGWFLLKRDGMHVIRERMPVGAEERAHRHSKARQFFYVLSGELTMRFSAESVVMKAGEGVEVAPGLVHQARNESDGVVEFLVVSCPPSHGDREDVENL